MIVDYNDKILKNSKSHVRVTCPCCNNSRYSQLNNVKRMKSSLCNNCLNKVERIFKQDENSLWYTMDDFYKIIVDYEDIPKLKVLVNICVGAIWKCHKYRYPDMIKPKQPTQLLTNPKLKDKSISVLTNENKKLMPYAVIRNSNKSQTMTHYILNIEDSKIIVDHINHNTLDNRKFNLRIANTHYNGLNSQMKSSNKSGFKNISLNSRNKKWSVEIFKKDGSRIRKRFYDFLEAYTFWKDNSNKAFRYDALKDAQIKLKYADIIFDDVANGNGLGAVVFSQFCSHHCENCQNPQTWSKEGGKCFTRSILNDILNYYRKIPFASRLTLSGGDPLDNLPLSNLIASEFKYYFPTKSLWIYTGYTYEEIIDKYEYQAILELCDYLVDGEYVDNLRDITLEYRGSKNQRIIDMKETRNNNGVVVLWKNAS